MFKKLSAMPYAQAKVQYYDNGNMSLISYATTVIEIVNGWLYVNGFYSRTTTRHISAFLKEFTPFDLKTAKTLYRDNIKINIFTGEVEKI